MLTRRRFVVQGQVQGVGFRPFVFALAGEFGLTGFVRNSPRGVVVEVQGSRDKLHDFAQALESRLPPLARIASLSCEECAPLDSEPCFTIVASTEGDSHSVLISPDIATCADCLRDVSEPGNRRFGYAFTNCTNCGPRYSITRSIPYDRPGTSMACFPMCPDCLAEYRNPRDRRFHAQPNACPACGPQVALVRAARMEAGRGGPHSFPFKTSRSEKGGESREAEDILYGGEALAALAWELTAGRIAAIKGLGGFHLACNARDDKAVALLRERKHRPHKPFAVMVADIEEAARVAALNQEEKELLLSRQRPVVICRSRPSTLSPAVSPDTHSVGLMLPYTPLHEVLFARLRDLRLWDCPGATAPLALVMTSGNPGGEPICLGNREALAKLANMADMFLLHNRDILIRVDDSVLRVLPGQGPLQKNRVLPYRRARGYVPEPIPLPKVAFETAGTVGGGGFRPCVLGVGAELKNTLCLTKAEDAFVSQHIGDMSNLETAAFHGEIRVHMVDILKVRPECIVRDLHPDFLSSRLAEDLGRENGVPVLALQHHFAHAHAVLAENGFSGKAIVLALDGTGLGSDKTLWGGEALLVDCSAGAIKTNGLPRHERLATFAPMDLPGGEAAIREPWRIAHALLLRLGLVGETGIGTENPVNGRELPWLAGHAEAIPLISRMIRGALNTPVSTSCGRLFDAVSALTGLCTITTYEGQAAIRLEEAQYGDGGKSGTAAYHCPVTHRDPIVPGEPVEEGGCLLRVLDTHALFKAVYADWIKGEPVPCIARKFHAGLAAGLVDLAAGLARDHGVTHIGLSGGCLHNVTLAVLLETGLKEAGLIPLAHAKLPPGDACISFGQAAWGRYVLAGRALSGSAPIRHGERL